jgi:hypothetical protein
MACYEKARFAVRHWLQAAALIGLLITTACGPGPTVTSGPFRQLSLLETDLRRGVSTKMDVQKVLGIPNGFGGAFLPTDPIRGNFQTFEVWFYDDIEITGAQSEGGGIIRANLRQQILQVFFKESFFDGFFWSSNSGVAIGQ